jgi:hypothetical protein
MTASVSTPSTPLSAKKQLQNAPFFSGTATATLPRSPIRPVKSINDLHNEISIRIDPASAQMSRRNSDISLYSPVLDRKHYNRYSLDVSKIKQL